MKIKDVMNKKVVTVDKYTSLIEAAQIMKKKDIGSLLVVENGALIGIITDRDIVMYLANNSINSVVAKAMTKDVKTVKDDAYVEDATDLMGYAQIKRVPVVNDKGLLLGIVSLADLTIDEANLPLAFEALKEICYCYYRNPTPPQLTLKVSDFPL